MSRALSWNYRFHNSAISVARVIRDFSPSENINIWNYSLRYIMLCTRKKQAYSHSQRYTLGSSLPFHIAVALCLFVCFIFLFTTMYLNVFQVLYIVTSTDTNTSNFGNVRLILQIGISFAYECLFLYVNYNRIVL